MHRGYARATAHCLEVGDDPHLALHLRIRRLELHAFYHACEQADVASFADALDAQSGMELESVTGPVDVLVIESAEQPTGD